MRLKFAPAYLSRRRLYLSTDQDVKEAIAFIAILAVIGAIGAVTAAQTARTKNSRDAGANWPLPLGEPGGSRYSTLTQINTANVAKLKRAWTFHTQSGRFSGAPMVIDSVMYFSANNGVFALDADHRVTPELRDELCRVFADPPNDIAGLYVHRRQIFRGKWIRHGGFYKYQLKIFQHSKAYLDDNEFDYRFYVNGPTGNAHLAFIARSSA